MVAVLNHTELVTPEEEAVQKVVLQNVSWETYQRLLEERGLNPQPRYNFFHGVLEIMVSSFEHENTKHDIDLLVELLAGEMEIDLVGGASTTFQREDLASGFEPDSCFYIKNAARVRGRKRLNIRKDPPPDLVIEIDITNPSLKKSPIFAALGVPEIWRYSKNRVTIHKLIDGDYLEIAESETIPGVTGEQIAQLVAHSRQMKRGEWIRGVRDLGQTLKTHR